jgi:hypothetical protein
MNWEKNGARPYISESGLKNHLENQGYSAAKIRKAVDPSNGDGLIGGLLQANMIEPFEHGWVIVDENWSSAMLIRKDGGSQ